MAMGVNLQHTLKPLLAAKGWTQDQLAEATGIRRTDINALAQGRIEAGDDRLRRIAAALDVSVLELGAPLEEADERGQTLLSLLAKLSETVDAQQQVIDALREKVQRLEARPAPRRRASGGR